MKSVLVIDIPTTCAGCPCYDYIHEVCAITHKDCELRKQAKPSWCPLRPLPQFEEEAVPYQVSETEVDCYQDPYATGWNDCLEAITGETE